LKYFTRLDLTLANYFGPQLPSRSAQKVTATNPQSGAIETHVLEFHHFNLEEGAFPFETGSFDLVLLCEVIEHLQMDPVKVLLEIKRVLKPGGHLVLTTPNVSRLENVCRMAAGVNIYDPYSGYGPYGRHNREYNKHELALLLEYCGFELEVLFSADVHENVSSGIFPLDRILPLVRFREHDLGQYLFSRSCNSKPARSKRPSWLYRSYSAADLEP
jgi:SAM-dependent methyltransferase